MAHHSSSSARAFARTTLAVVTALIASLATIFPEPTWAGSSGQLCIKEKIGGNPPCTANDVRISSLVASGGTITCTPGDLLNLTLTATIESGPARYDIGLWVNETGGSALSDPGGTCYRDYLNPRSANNVGCSQTYPGPYFNGEVSTPADTCGDVPATSGSQLCGSVPAPCTGGGGNCIFTTYRFTATFECVDSNSDGIADLGTCSSWDNNTNTTCTSELDTDPGTGSKCNCGRTNVANIFIDPCVSANCDDGIACTVDSCDSSSGSAVCSHTPNNSVCNDGQFCNGVETCNALSGCQAGTPPNCSDAQACTNDVCNESTDQCDHVPNNASCSDGLFCTGTEICDPLAGCLDGMDPNCDDGVACSVDACDEANDTCTHTANNGACNDGQFCNGTETCNVVNGCQAGTPPNCNDGVTCTLDACNETTDTCDHTANNATCDNALFCDGTETCNPLTGCQPGVAPNCSDGVTCTLDACSEANDICTHTPNNASCSDGLFCSGVEICDPVNDCEPGSDPCPGASCDESNDLCSGCLTNADCNNGVFCDGAEVCGPGSICQAGTPPNCNDGVACTVDSCDEANDTCAHSPSNAFCNDGQFCNGVETCDSVNDCQAGTPPNCNDGVACTGDLCNETTDTCDHTPNDASCSNGLFCDGAEVCNPLTNCQPGTPPDCNDGVGCTADGCDEANDTCAHSPSNAFCSDGQFCNGAETCDLLNDCQAGVAPNCADSQACTVDSCNEVNDQCVNTAADALCSDGLFCNGAETCDALNGCLAGSPPNCTDSFACTVDNCNEATDTCDHTPNNTVCSDGLFCTGIETCNVNSGCVSGPTVNCNDAFVCSFDTCDDANNTCSHDLSSCTCGDGEVTGTEECEPPGTSVGTEDCTNGIDDDGDLLIDCEDGLDCTAHCEFDPDVACTNHHTCRQLPGAPFNTKCVADPSGCDANCQGIAACNVIARDPAIIRFGDSPGEPDYFSMHGSFVPRGFLDPAANGMALLITNANGVVYEANLAPGDLLQAGIRYSFKDPTAKQGNGTRDGLYQVTIKQRVKDSQINYAFKVRAYGDFSRATEPLMMVQVKFGGDGALNLGEWQRSKKGWQLFPIDF